MKDIIKTVGTYEEIADKIINSQDRIKKLKEIEDTTGVKGVFSTHLLLIIEN